MKNKKMRIVILILLVALSLTSCGGGDVPSGLERISFVLDWTPNTNHTGVYVAIANGYYEDAGLSVEILDPPETGAAAFVASGRAEFGVDFQDWLAMVLTLDEPMPVTAVAAIISHNNSGVISLKERGIDDFSKLEGMTYASWELPVELAILKQTMTDAGGNFDALRVVPYAADALQMIQSGLVDAVWVFESWDVVAAELSGMAYNFLPFVGTSPVLDFYTPVIIANDDFLASNPETARKFMQATAAGYRYAIENPESAARILLEAVPELPEDLIFASQELLAETYAAADGRWGFFDAPRWGAFYDWMYEEGIIPVPLGSTGFTNDFL